MISKNYSELFKPSLEVISNAGKPYYHFVMFGNEGVEGYKVVRDESEIKPETISKMKLRARINAHRNVSVFAFKSDSKVDMNDITKKMLKGDHVIKLN
jgi:hypothetical protein